MPRFLRKFRRSRPVSTELAPLETLPVEIVEKILFYLQQDCHAAVEKQGYTDHELAIRSKNMYLRTLISLAKCSKTLQTDLLAPVIYRQVLLTCKTQVERFYKALSKGYIRPEIVAAVETVIFEEVTNDNPQQVTIASYSYNTDSHQKTYQELLVAIVKKLPSLQQVRISNMAPKFQFRSSKPSLHVKSLTVSTEPGWRVYIQPDMLEQFPNIDTLSLQDIVIDENSLSRKTNGTTSPAGGSPLAPTKSQNRTSSYFSFRPSSPKQTKDDKQKEEEQKLPPPSISTLELTDCIIHPSAVAELPQFFDRLHTLTLRVKAKSQTKLLAVAPLLATLQDLTVEIQPSGQTDLLPHLEKYNAETLPNLQKLTLVGITPSLLTHPQFVAALEKMAIKTLDCHLVQKPSASLAQDLKLPLTPTLYYKNQRLNL
ncbi:hypothetical protein CKK34_2378 [Yarrowia sp. E02]|nr:hypothetical protein CKK34_2378 [Yarrowia sp. E02]